MMSSASTLPPLPARDRRSHLWALVLLALGSAGCPPRPPQPGEVWTGKVVKVADGDTLTVLAARQQIKVRLHGVDCPERDQPFGQQARRLTTRLTAGRQVTVTTVELDRYGRQVGAVEVEGQDLAEALVSAGLAWWYQRYAPKAQTLRRLEQEARLARRGLWSEPAPLPPWRWRQQQSQRQPRAKQRRPPKQTGAPAGGAGDALGSLLGDRIGDAYGTAAVDVSHPVSGNVRSKVFHWFTCKHSSCQHCTAHFKTIAEAQAAGYRPHRACVDQDEGAGAAGNQLTAPAP